MSKLKLILCSVCHAATGVTTRLVSGSLVERLRSAAPAVTDAHIDTHLCPECIQAAARALEARIGRNQGIALAVDYTGVLPVPSRDDGPAIALASADSADAPRDDGIASVTTPKRKRGSSKSVKVVSDAA